MDNPSNNQDENQTSGFARYASKRVIFAAVLIIVVVWAFSQIPDAPILPHKSDQSTTAAPPRQASKDIQATEHEPAPAAGALPAGQEGHETAAGASQAATEQTAESGHAAAETKASDQVASDNVHPPAEAAPGLKAADHAAKAQVQEQPAGQQAHQAPAKESAEEAPAHEILPTGATFVDAVIAPLDHELNQRFWGWRPNDIINFTDNVNHFQLGVLEVTRRTAVLLAERISRTGTTDSFDPHLENAMNWLMVKANRYWFPSPESKYKESLRELKAYRKELMKERASFFTRTDNLIPLLLSYEDLLGSCDENLVKQKNEDGTEISLFKADDYFFYAKGVASAMATVLEAMHHDFLNTLESRHATELLHHALESCRRAASLDPLLITDGKLDGILANHRAHMAAPISHARFYLGQLVKTLST